MMCNCKYQNTNKNMKLQIEVLRSETSKQSITPQNFKFEVLKKILENKRLYI